MAETDEDDEKESGPEAYEFAFLGREFLTWLLYHVEKSEGKFEGFHVHFGDRVVMRSLAGEIGEMRVKGDQPGNATDLRFAIAGGQTIREAELLFTARRRVFKLMLVAETFDMKGVKLPDELAEPAAAQQRQRSKDSERELDEARTETAVESRMQLLEELDGMLATAFNAFLDLRLSDAWAEEIVPELRDWLIESLSE